MTGFLSPSHILLLLVVVLLLFGAKRLPEFGRSLGSGMREFKHSLDHDQEEAAPQITGAAVPEADAKSSDAHQAILEPDP
jgi:sec-independent protein translocase protein TatA